jgi:hypothetical protein
MLIVWIWRQMDNGEKPDMILNQAVKGEEYSKVSLVNKDWKQKAFNNENVNILIQTNNHFQRCNAVIAAHKLFMEYQGADNPWYQHESQIWFQGRWEIMIPGQMDDVYEYEMNMNYTAPDGTARHSQKGSPRNMVIGLVRHTFDPEPWLKKVDLEWIESETSDEFLESLREKEPATQPTAQPTTQPATHRSNCQEIIKTVYCPACGERFRVK